MGNDIRTNKRKLGDLGEDIACKFLISHGFKILERNYLKKYGEIDIISQKASSLYFFEVKSVSCEIKSSNSNKIDTFKPEDNLHEKKLKRIWNTIQTYLSEKNISHETDWRCDGLIVYIDKKSLTSKIEVLENILS